MTRRDLLKYSAGVLGALAVGGGARLLDKPSAAGAQTGHGHAHGPGAEPEEIIDSFTRRGRSVKIGRVKKGGDDEVMVLDERVLSKHVFVKLGRRRYASHMLPFEEFETARDLANALVDNSGLLFVV